jgi:hypothetical protein
VCAEEAARFCCVIVVKTAGTLERIPNAHVEVRRALGRHNAAFTKTRARTQVLVARGDDTGASVTSARTRRSGSAAHMSLGRSGSAGGHIGSIVAGVCEANGVGIATVRPCRSVACPCVCHPLISHIWGWGTVVCICQVQCAALGWRTCRMFVRVSAPGCAASLPPPSQLQQRQLLLQLLQLRHHLTRAPLYIYVAVLCQR